MDTYNDIINSILQQRNYLLMVDRREPNHICIGREYFEIIKNKLFKNYFTTEMIEQSDNFIIMGMTVTIDEVSPHKLLMGYMEQVPVYKFTED